ncbi:exodeoxyribonuclease VII large subunit [Candidatus Saccharibacteria bacterium]|jgi:exodeoxyribonuclease VII large subunit|nr:exodeoxyribonuclease VII large subunit [Candidatus Saccharibacteria bacterium]
MDDLVFSVGEFVSVFNQTLEMAYPKAIITGEIISSNIWRDRLVFFDIKDDEASLSCMIPLAMLGIQIEEGMQVRIIGRPKLSQKGRLSINVQAVIPEGEGALQRAFVLLKQKLESQGLFDEDRKRPLPDYPESIAVITAGQSAAWADFQKIISERWPLCIISLFDCQVQGDVAANQIVRSVEMINQSSKSYDMLAVVRGGGSLEDLQSFNDETVVRAIAGSRIPTITGVGHESDTTLVDYVSDIRASTPTNAAQVAVPDYQQVLSELDYIKGQLTDTIKLAVEKKYQRLASNLRTIERIGGTGRIKEQIQHFKQSIEDGQRRTLTKSTNQLHHYESVLEALNPKIVLKRGYSIVRNHGLTSNGNNVSIGDELSIEFESVNIISEVTDVKSK